MTKEQLAEQYAEENNSAYTNDYYGFLAGFSAKEKIIKDKYNHYNSLLKEANIPKLDRRDRTEYIIKLEAKVEVLKSLL